MLFLLSLFSFFAPAHGSIYVYYNITRFTEGTCTPIKVEVEGGQQVGRIAIGAGIEVEGDSPPRQEVAFVRDDASTMEVCWPDQVGRNGDYPTTLTVLEDFIPGTGSAPLYWVVTNWAARMETQRTEFGDVIITIGTSRPIKSE